MLGRVGICLDKVLVFAVIDAYTHAYTVACCFNNRISYISQSISISYQYQQMLAS